MTEPEIIKEGWVVITPTLCQGQTMSWKTENDKGELIPIVYDTPEEAWKIIAEDMIVCFQQFIEDERRLEDTDFGTEEYIALYQEFDNGEICVSDDDGNPIIETTIEKWRESL